VIGFLNSGSHEPQRLAGFQEGLKQLGFVEGQNVTIEYHALGGNFDQLPALAADLVRRHVAVIAVSGTPAALAAKGATATLPIVFSVGSDPVELGLVDSLSRPGGNITGVTTLEVALGPKQLQLLHELVPAANTVALLVNRANRFLAEATSREMQAAARGLGVDLLITDASSERDFETAFETLVQRRVGALAIGSDVFFDSRSKVLGALSARHRLPAVSQFREFAAAGGLMSYGTPPAGTWRQNGLYTGRILKGEKPADLPIWQPTKFEFVINLKTTKALGLTIPETLLATADEVIQ
jgi:putative ABC transport system substrate-binding protein